MKEEEKDYLIRIVVALESIAKTLEELNDDGAVRVVQVETGGGKDEFGNERWGWVEK